MEAGAGTSEVLREREGCRAEARRYVKGEKKKQIPRRDALRNDNEDKGRRKISGPRKRGAHPGPQKAGPTLQKGWGTRGGYRNRGALARLRECRFPGATSGLTARITRRWTVGLPIPELPTRTVDLARLC